MKVVVASGIWPPDVGGPASHCPELASFLVSRGHRVEVLTLADRAPPRREYRIQWVDRRLKPGLRHARFAWELVRLAREADVVYSVSVPTRSLAARGVGTPLVLKLTDDPAFERARRLGLAADDLDAFQRIGGRRVALLRLLRDAALRGAALVTCPSEYLRGHVIAWGVEPERVVVVPNPAPALPRLESREALRASFGGRVLAFAGRLVPAKALDVAIEALAEVDGVTLLVAGDGPERETLERQSERAGVDERVLFLGPRPRAQVLELFGLADAALLSSRWENSPHVAIEALAVSAPVISTNVGGVAETVVDGENGLLVPSDDPHALAREIRRFFADAELRDRLRGSAAASVARLSADDVHGRIEELLRENARDAGRRGHGHLAAGRGRSGHARA